MGLYISRLGVACQWNRNDPHNARQGQISALPGVCRYDVLSDSEKTREDHGIVAVCKRSRADMNLFNLRGRKKERERERTTQKEKIDRGEATSMEIDVKRNMNSLKNAA